MLQAMRQPAPSQSSPSLSNFAGLLATLASPSPQSDADDDAPLWNSSDLGEDVATLSYERALRAHARYRPPDRDSDRVDKSLTQADGSRSVARADASVKTVAAGATDAAGAVYNAVAAVRTDAAPGLQTGTARESDLRSASVTIRLSQAECMRLHQRAAEAGLTVSAYLRSCAVEAEALREQVKQALAELKAGTEGPKDRGNKKSAQRTFFGWIRWFTRRG